MSQTFVHSAIRRLLTAYMNCTPVLTWLIELEAFTIDRLLTHYEPISSLEYE